MGDGMWKDYQPFVREALDLPEGADVAFALIFQGGSERSFYRVRAEGRPAGVFMHYDPGREENSGYSAIAEFLRGIGVSVPRVIRHDPACCFILMEDLGETDLWSFRDEPWEERRRLYRLTLDLADRLHTFPLDDFPSPTVQLMEGFGPALYRWEQDYFREHFLEGFCRIELGRESGRIGKELASLAGRLDQAGRSLVHRDFQSRNVMIRGDEPVLIDFQGLRLGSPFYDLGSLLYDPYVSFSLGERLELLSYYYILSNRTLDWTAFKKAFYEASAQRLMQALGAYGFLGMRRGLVAFLDHIPRGVDHLFDAAARSGSLPRLRDLAARCREKLIAGKSGR